ncbi:MAG: hypothetical protein F6K41_08975 [Symploca sp. SIO3E6]|nr:hypothetical protein [Caldora sp. SIO3E6]
MPKRELNRFPVSMPLPFLKRQEYKSVIRLERDPVYVRKIPRTFTLEDPKDSPDDPRTIVKLRDSVKMTPRVKPQEPFQGTGNARETPQPAVTDSFAVSEPESYSWSQHYDYPPPVSQSNSTELTYQKNQGRQSLWQWSLLWLSILSLVGGAVASGLLLLTKLPPPINCQQISLLSPDGDRFHCAQLAADSGEAKDLVAAITLVKSWPKEHSLYPEAQRMMTEWSGAILQQGQKQINQGNQSEAVAIASQIPVTSPLYPEAQAAIASWQQEWQRSQETLGKFKDALKGQNWRQAFLLLNQLSRLNPDYWNLSRTDALVRQVSTEREAWEQLEEARTLAQSNRLPKLEEAIQKASKINPNSYIKAQAQVELSLWSRTLLRISAIELEQGNFAQAINIAQRIPINTSLYQEAQDWIRLSRASEAAQADNILGLIDALAGVRQINPKSPVYPTALTQGTLWESKLQDQTKLQFAQILSKFEQKVGHQVAIEQAALVELGSPQRLLAQTLIAQWRQEIWQIEDQQKLLRAQQLATGGTIEELRAAVAQASKIKQGRPLHSEAQKVIAQWHWQIKTLEDQPILDLAKTFAQRLDLVRAISTARQIRPGSAVYAEAQKVLAGWVTQLQIAEDSPILDAAVALADQGRLDAAIAIAGKISAERVLYEQAQKLKNTWIDQKVNGELRTE